MVVVSDISSATHPVLKLPECEKQRLDKLIQQRKEEMEHLDDSETVETTGKNSDEPSEKNELMSVESYDRDFPLLSASKDMENKGSYRPTKGGYKYVSNMTKWALDVSGFPVEEGKMVGKDIVYSGNCYPIVSEEDNCSEVSGYTDLDIREREPLQLPIVVLSTDLHDVEMDEEDPISSLWEEARAFGAIHCI